MQILSSLPTFLVSTQSMRSLCEVPEPRLNIKTVFPGIATHVIKMRRSSDRLVSMMGISIPARRHLYIEPPPGSQLHSEKEQTNLSTIWVVSFCQYTLFYEMLVFQATKYLYRSFACLSLTFAWVRVFGSKNRVTLVSLTHMRTPNASCCCPTRATCVIGDTLVFVRAPSDLLTAISNENKELSHTTPNATTMTPEAATLATLVLPINWRVSRVA